VLLYSTVFLAKNGAVMRMMLLFNCCPGGKSFWFLLCRNISLAVRTFLLLAGWLDSESESATNTAVAAAAAAVVAFVSSLAICTL
jgi:hypothetical protein